MIKIDGVEKKIIQNMYRSWQLHKKLRNKFKDRPYYFNPGHEDFVTLIERESFLDKIFNMIFS